jgi:serine/threonine-protein kinase ATR
MEDQAFSHEYSGRWAEALSCYEQAMQLKPRELGPRLGLLNCLKNLGQLETLLSLVHGSITQYADPKEKVFARALFR